MFYSHEILMNRKYGVATVWLVATLGENSTLRKVNRKAILEVNVKKACETIIQPEAPMALRLQSNLLYGVSRVYSQQCGYILADAQVARNSLKTLLRAVKQNELDPNAGKAQPDQLILMDDPAFMPDMILPNFDFDFDFSNLNLDRADIFDSQVSGLSPWSHSRRDSGTFEERSALGLIIPGSDAGTYHLPYNNEFQLPSSSVRKTFGRGLHFQDEEEALIDNFDFEFDADGKIRDINVAERDLLLNRSTLPELYRMGNDSAASGRVRLEHEEARARLGQDTRIDEDGDFIMHFDEGLPALPDAEAFSPLVATTGAQPIGGESEALPAFPTVTSSVSAEAPLKKRKRRQAKRIAADQQIELQNSDLRSWQADYLKNMDAAIHHKIVNRAPALAKKNAYAWVFGNGIGGIGRAISLSQASKALGVFSGTKIVEKIIGVPRILAVLSPSKRQHEDGDDGGSEKRHVRPRQDHNEDQIGRGAGEDEFIPVYDDPVDPEIGRGAESALADHASSAMPWNISASLNSFRNFTGLGSSSIQGRSAIGGRQSSIMGGRAISHLTNASPLLGRGRADPQDPEKLDDLDPIGVEVEDVDLVNFGGEGRTLSAFEAEQFEIFGPTAGADTQTAQSTEWIKEALARESLNFLDYVRNTLRKDDFDEPSDDELARRQLRDDDHGKRAVSFGSLFPPETNSMMVAAQAFHHVLTLATKDFLSVRQDEPFEDIWMGIKGEL